MVHVRVRQHLDAPPDRVWAVLSDFGAIADWVDDLSESRVVLGEGLQPGTERVCTYVTPVAGQPSIREVVRHVGEREFAYDIPDGLAVYRRGRSHWRVEDAADGCVVHFETELQGGGFLGWLLAGRARRGIRNGIARALEGLEVHANQRDA